MDELRVPKRRASGEVVLPGGAARAVTFFLAEFAADHPGPERVSDLINSGNAFVPATDVQSGATTFLHVSSLAVVRVESGLEEGAAEEHTIPTEHEVSLTLTDGHRLTGLLTYVRPPDRSRLVDHLNEKTPFLRLLEERSVALVNKRFVAQVDLVPSLTPIP
jgi:hypothetical protein